MKKFSFILVIIFFCSCSNPILDVPLSDVIKHRKYIKENEYSKKDYEMYKELFESNPDYQSEPYIYYYLGLFNDGQKYVTLGLNKFNNDPLLTHLKIFDSNASDKEKLRLYKKNINNHPTFPLSISNWIVLSKYNELYKSGNSYEYIYENRSSVNEMRNILDGYKNGKNKSKYYDFLSTEWRSIEEATNVLVKAENGVSAMEGWIEEYKETLKELVRSNFPGTYINYPYGTSSYWIKNEFTFYSTGSVLFKSPFGDGGLQSGRWKWTGEKSFEILLDIRLSGDVESDGDIYINGLGRFEKF